MKAEQVLTASYEWSDKPLNVDDIDGLRDAVERVEMGHGQEFVRCPDRVAHYDVRWNEKTESVRIDALAPGTTYEVTDGTDLGDFE